MFILSGIPAGILQPPYFDINSKALVGCFIHYNILKSYSNKNYDRKLIYRSRVNSVRYTAFPVAAVRAWNSLPSSARTSSMYVTFRRERKALLLKQWRSQEFSRGGAYCLEALRRFLDPIFSNCRGLPFPEKLRTKILRIFLTGGSYAHYAPSMSMPCAQGILEMTGVSCNSQKLVPTIATPWLFWLVNE